jgi:predicted PurR-regulated permease PerM
VIPERAIRFPVRTILAVLAIVIGVWALLQVVLITRHVLTWILVALFLAIALSPAVDWLQEKGIRRRGYAVALTSLGVAGVIALIGWLVVPPLCQVNEFARKVPTTSTIHEGRGRQPPRTKYQFQRVREAFGGGAARFRASGTAIRSRRAL